MAITPTAKKNNKFPARVHIPTLPQYSQNKVSGGGTCTLLIQKLSQLGPPLLYNSDNRSSVMRASGLAEETCWKPLMQAASSTQTNRLVQGTGGYHVALV
jgi:hypothetical protein